MTRKAITTDKIARPVGPFSQAIESGGFLFFSGQVAQSPADGRLIAGGVAEQTEQIFHNLAALLSAATRTYDDVVRTTVYLVDMADFSAMNGVYGRYFASPPPARTTVAVKALPLGAKVEIEVLVR